MPLKRKVISVWNNNTYTFNKVLKQHIIKKKYFDIVKSLRKKTCIVLLIKTFPIVSYNLPYYLIQIFDTHIFYMIHFLKHSVFYIISNKRVQKESWYIIFKGKLIFKWFWGSYTNMCCILYVYNVYCVRYVV